MSRLTQLSKEYRQKIYEKTVLKNKYIPHKPTTKQAEFLRFIGEEALYGGAAGGGKSDALLMAALQFVDQPGYSAILFRKTFQDLTLPEALLDRALTWLSPTDAKWNVVNHTWTFPSGARLCFGYVENDRDKFRYQSSAFQYIGFDEVTQFYESSYRYLFSRLRRLENIVVPLRMRAASNPGNIGHDWVKRRFIDEGIKYGRIFIPAKLVDNPHLDRDTYIRSLQELDPITRRQYLEGDWTAKQGRMKFKREWFEIVDNSPPLDAARIRYWDMAATTPKDGNDPDWTCGVKLAVFKGVYYVEDVQHFRETPMNVEQRIKQTGQIDLNLHGYGCQVFMEQEPGSAGVSMIDHYARNIMVGLPFRGHHVSGDKEIRANPVSSAAQMGNVKLVIGTWVGAYLDELESFPLGSHDDQVDATSGAFETLQGSGPIEAFTGEVPW